MIQKEAIRIGNKVKEISNINIFKNTRRRDHVEVRALLCFVLKEKLRMGPSDIARCFVYLGKTMNHATVIHLQKKYPMYKKYNHFLNKIEKSFIFKEGTEEKDGERINFLETQYTELVLKYKELKNSIDDNPKLNLLHDIPDDKLDEVIERISMLKKSWSWKNKDSCEILECY